VFDEVRSGLLCVLLGTVLALGCGSDERFVDSWDPGETGFEPRATTKEPGERRFVELAAPGGVPGVSRQPTERGRSIGSLQAFGPRVHLGYGDYSDNTGPIASVSYSVTNEAFDVGQELPTEEILDYAVHDRFLFAADLDPRGHEAWGSVFRMADWTSGWRAMPPVEGAVHTFAMAEFEGRLFAGTGSVNAEPAMLVSTSDQGTTWHVEHQTESPEDGFSRYTHLAATPSQLFLSGRVHTEPGVPFAYLHANGRFRPVQGLPEEGFLIPLSLGTDLVVLHFSGDRGKGGVHLSTYEVVDDSLVPNDDGLPEGTRVVNFSTEKRSDAGDRLWLLGENGEAGYAVYSAERLGEWTLVAELPELADGDRPSALGYLDNSLYLGSAAGGFYAIRGVFELL